MMDELPAIIHRLSLQLWCPDQVSKTDETPQEQTDEQGINPFASPPDDPVDADGNVLDTNAISELTLHGAGEVQSLFSQKNLLRLAALTDSHRTLSLFTPGIRDVVFRAWTGHGDKSDNNTPAITTPSLSRMNSIPGAASTTYTFSDTGSAAHGHLPSRPSMVSLHSSPSGLALASSGRSRQGRRKKTRVVNLRKSKTQEGFETATDTASDTASVEGALSEPIIAPSVSEEPEDDAQSEIMPAGRLRFARDEKTTVPLRHSLLSQSPLTPENLDVAEAEATDSQYTKRNSEKLSAVPIKRSSRPKAEQASSSSDTSSVILEQAWLMKVAGEMARRSTLNEKYSPEPVGTPVWQEQDAPPTYEAAIH